MVAEIVCVGTELLLGDIVNTNAQHISKELAPVSYTHLDVYKRQVSGATDIIINFSGDIGIQEVYEAVSYLLSLIHIYTIILMRS